MDLNAKPRRNSRGLVLTEQSLKIIDQELRKWWASDGEQQANAAGKTKKLSREAKAARLGLDAKTVDKIYRCQPVSELVLRDIFSALKISPPFSKERYCLPTITSLGNLPNAATPCIGRQTQVRQIEALLESAGLVTLTGAGGIGKTRLSLQVAAEVKSRYAAGAWFVELAGITDPAHVPQEVARVLGVPEEKGRSLSDTLANFLRGKPLLLILDNCEHLLPACARLANHLLAASADLRMLATSRERLNIPFERPYPVPALAVPDMKREWEREEDIAHSLMGYDAARLFVERVRVHNPGFAVTNQNARVIASICHRLDGIPLALELAAARVHAMSLHDFEQGLNQCFRMLTGGNRAALARHQTLRATLDWSYNLLNAQEQAMLNRLSVFADGWGREAAEYVCAGNGIEEAEALNLLASLVDKSLVVYQEWEGKSRYRLLETVRQYGRERLEASGESDTARERHRDCFLTLAETAEPELTGREQAAWLQSLETEHENLRAGLEWSLYRSEASVGLRLCGALKRFWLTRGYLSEGRQWCARALAAGDRERTAERARALTCAGGLAYYQGDYASARTYLDESLDVCREMEDRSGQARALNGLGLVVSNLGDCDAARSYYKQSLAICREIGDRKGMAGSLNGLGSMAEPQGDYASARSYYEASLVIYQEVGDQSSIANTLKNIGYVAHSQGDYAFARHCLDKSLDISREIADRSGIAYALCGLGHVAHSQRDCDAARSYYEQSLAICRELGDRSGVAYSLGGLGRVAQTQGDYAGLWDCCRERLSFFREIGRWPDMAAGLDALAGLAVKAGDARRAAALWGAVEALRRDKGLLLPPGEREAFERAVADAREILVEEAFGAAWSQGGSLTPEQATEYAR